MTRSELIEALKIEFKTLPTAYVEQAVQEIFATITRTLAQGGRAEFRGFGTFTIKDRPKRVGRNPKTGKHVEVEEKSLPYFRCSRSMIARLNKW